MDVRGLRVSNVFLYTMMFDILLRIIPTHLADITGEYCNEDTFNAKCRHNEVILMVVAKYGRMRMNRCVTVDFGFIGCQTDVLGEVDAHCSGRSQCQFAIAPTLKVTNPCYDLTRYLNVTYTCLPVVKPSKDMCEPSTYTKLMSDSGYLSNQVSAETGCGTANNPWFIEASAARRINLTLYDFKASGTTASADSEAGSCGMNKYATVEDVRSGESHAICSAGKRVSHAYLSEGNSVRIVLYPPSTAVSHFILHYQVVGCRNPRFPGDTWVKREKDKVTVGCLSSNQQWVLLCEGGEWKGPKIKCFPVERQTGVHRKKGKTYNWFSSGIVIGAIVSIAVVISTGIVVCGVVFLKRRTPRQRRRRRTTRERPALDPDYVTTVGPSAGKSFSYSEEESSPMQDNNTHYLQPYH